MADYRALVKSRARKHAARRGRGSLRQRASRGISLAEVLVVAGIAVIMVGVAVPALQDEDVAGPEVRRIVADLVRTRGLARTSWKPTVVRTDTVSGRWRCERNDGSSIEGPGAGTDGWRDIDDRVTLESVSGKTHTFTFLPNGRAQEAAGVRLRTNGITWLIELDPLSGRIEAAPEAVTN